MTDEPDRPDKAASPERDTADSDCSRWVAEFAADLRRMHEKAQKPSLRQMSMKVPYSHTALSNALRGAGGHLPSQKLTLALVRACGGDEQAWSARWQQEHARITAHAKSRDRGLGAGEAVPSEFHVRSPFRRPGRPILLSALGVASALVIGVVFEFNHGGGSVPPTDGFGGALPICEQSGTYNSCEIQQRADRVPRGETSQQMKEFIAGFSKNPPQQSGPWPFFVYDTIVTQEDMGRLANATPADIGKDFGLHVRTTPTERAQYVGTVNLGSVVWADCYLTNTTTQGPRRVTMLEVSGYVSSGLPIWTPPRQASHRPRTRLGSTSMRVTRCLLRTTEKSRPAHELQPSDESGDGKTAIRYASSARQLMENPIEHNTPS